VIQDIRQTPSGETASTLILIGLIFQAIAVVALLGVGALLSFVPFLGLIVLFIAGIGVVWLFVVYLFSYKPTKAGEYSSARTATLVFGILSILTAALIPGVLYIIAYVKLGDAEREAAQIPPAWGAPPSAPSFGVPPPPPPARRLDSGTKFCSNCGQPNSTSATFCQSCGARIG
jgi:hypothetical protein